MARDWGPQLATRMPPSQCARLSQPEAQTQTLSLLDTAKTRLLIFEVQNCRIIPGLGEIQSV